MASSQYQGSQAYNQSLLGNEYVNKSTGTLVVSIALVQLRGITDAMGLNLTLNFVAGTDGQLGLPEGWGLGISFVADGQSLTVDGKTFVIDPNWTDSSGYQSGLKYLNDHGRKFETVIPPQPIPGGGGNYQYRLRYDDGAVSYYDALGKLMAHADLFGNTICYSYANPLSDVFTNRLATITDTFGQVITFGYLENEIRITLPDQSTVSIFHSSQTVQYVENQLGAVTEFQYVQAAGSSSIGRINYPTGQRTTITYSALDYLDQNGNAGTRPAVKNLYRSNASGNFLSSSTYSYGTDSGGQTYTGYAGGYRMGSASDGLMDSNNTAYVYDVLEQRLDENGEQIAASRTYFDFLHNPISEHSYLINSAGHTELAHRNTYTYDLVLDAHARSVNTNKPVKTVHSVYDAAIGDWQQNSIAETSYNLFGNIVTSKQYEVSEGTPQQVGARDHTYVDASWGGQMPQRTEYSDLVTNTVKRLDFTLSSDQKSVSSVTISRALNGAKELSPYKTKNYEYDVQGRQTSWTLTWAPGYVGEKGNISQVSEQTTFAYDENKYQLTTDTTDANGHTRTAVFDTSLPGGPCLLQTKPTGAQRSFEYDAMGRLTKETDPLGNVALTAYKLYSLDGSNSSTTTQANKYAVRTTYDARGRAIEMEDNGDPTRSGTDITRILRRVSFNGLDMKASETDATGQIATYEYDGLARQILQTDSLGNTRMTSYDDVDRKITTHLNGDLRTVISRDGLGNILSTDTYADSSSAQAGHVQQVQSTYDGFGQTLTEIHATFINGNRTQNSEKTFIYTMEGDVASFSFTGTPEDTAQTATKTITQNRDLNDNVTLVTREVSYDGTAHPPVKSEQLTYDPVGNLIEIVNQTGQTELLTYTADSALATRTRYDGTVISYTYDAAGQFIQQRIDDHIQTTNVYASNGLVETITDAQGTVHYAYSLDGSAAKVTYADGKELLVTQDGHGRVTRIVLPDGTTGTYTYNELNQITSQTMGELKLENTWGTVNHSHGILVQQNLSGPVAQTTRLGYDGFGDNDAVTVTNNQGKQLFASTTQRNGWRNIVNTTLSSEVTSRQAVNQRKAMVYDGLSQLTETTVATAGGSSVQTSFRYDGAANVLCKTIDGTSLNFSYNALNQITSGSVRYDANGRMVRDADDNVYTYDAVDRLLQVQLASGTSLSNMYGPQGALSTVTEDGKTDAFYPLTGSVVSVAQDAKSDTPHWHSLLWAGGAPVGEVSGGEATAFLSSDASVRLHVATSDTTTVEISSYGRVVSETKLKRSNSFNWNSQYTDPTSGLTYLRTRWYAPTSMQFLTLDPLLTANRYAYGMGNPIAEIDPLGQDGAEIAAIVIGAVVGIAATVLTGGAAGAAAAAVFGTECVAASVTAGALSGAVGSVAGDVTGALISGQKITGSRIGIDLLSGVVGGAVGAGLGGSAGQVAMRSALNTELSQAAITRIGLITSGAVGGLTGAAAAGGITSLAHRQPYFSSENIIGMVVGFTAGVGGGFLTSGAYLGKVNSKIIPVPIADNELHLITPAVDTRNAVAANERLLVMAPQPEAEESATGFRDGPGGYKYAMRLDFGNDPRPAGAPGATQSVDTIAGHGAGNTIFASVDVAGNGQPDFVRPITGKRFAKYLLQHTDFGTRGGAVKLMSCFGAYRNAQVISNALQREVWAGYPALDRYSFTDWVRFQPS